ncbi:MAG: hypothetical protein JWM34_2675 [Ilumatobacteraceae bacterium]|nr:hypothetical protein [Ilumatobacteraceae bacterium]
MTDDLDPSRLLASAALDDEVAPDERAVVDASPALRNELEAYRVIQAEMRDVVVPDAARESALAAAMAAFDALDAVPDLALAGAATPVAPVVSPVVSMEARRRRQTSWLGAAAAAVVAVLVVGVIIRTGSGEDRKTASTTQAPFATAAKSQATEVAAAAATPAPQIETAATTAGTTAESTADTTAGTTSVGQVGALNSEGSDSGGASPTPDPWAGAPSIDSQDALIAYATTVQSTFAADAAAATTSAASTADSATSDSTAATTAASAPPPSTAAAPAAAAPSVVPCEAGSILPYAAIVYMGAKVILVRNDASGMVTIVDPQSCTTLQTFVLPAP